MVMLNFINSRQTSSAHIDDPSCNDSTFTCKKKKKKMQYNYYYGKRNKILILKNRVRNHNKIIC